MSAFLRALEAHASGKSRVSLDGVWLAFREVDPVRAADTYKRRALRASIDALVADGHVKTPRSHKLWDNSADPPLPRWVQLVRVSATPHEAPAVTAWAPELEFARSVRHPGQLATLAAVQRFLASGGRTRPMVPSRERSLQVFGDEKALDGLARQELFRRGKLSFELLRCFPVSPPMVFEEADAATDVALLVENHHTYHSFCRWNAERKAYRAVGYGAGKAVLKSIGSFAEPARRMGIGRVEYFGDLDPAGLSIAAQLTEVAAREGLPTVVPAERWYRMMLELGGEAGATGDSSGGDAVAASSGVRWLPAELRPRATAWLNAGRALQQEIVGWEALADL